MNKIYFVLAMCLLVVLSGCVVRTESQIVSTEPSEKGVGSGGQESVAMPGGKIALGSVSDELRKMVTAKMEASGESFGVESSRVLVNQGTSKGLLVGIRNNNDNEAVFEIVGECTDLRMKSADIIVRKEQTIGPRDMDVFEITMDASSVETGTFVCDLYASSPLGDKFKAEVYIDVK